MSVPLDRLYNFLQTICNQDIIIYRFFPHGSKKWHDLSPLHLATDEQKSTHVFALFHDQEPVNAEWIPLPTNGTSWFKLRTESIDSQYPYTIFVHSEKNSRDVEKLEQLGAKEVYYWSHGLIARDWYRHAEIDPAIDTQVVKQQKSFLIYNRAWEGSREYRFKFLELLISSGLHQYCNVKFAEYENDKHYTQHKFKNNQFKTNCKFEELIEPNTYNSNASADYSVEDYNNSTVEIVLETMFDETKWHLTEKILRPIAVGKPFVLVSTPGSLEYLRSYGFKTFSPWINESYDLVQDPVERLQAIIAQMKKLNDTDNLELFAKCQEIADYNKRWFFSKNFYQLVVNEYVSNLSHAVSQIKNSVN